MQRYKFYIANREEQKAKVTPPMQRLNRMVKAGVKPNEENNNKWGQMLQVLFIFFRKRVCFIKTTFASKPFGG